MLDRAFLTASRSVAAAVDTGAPSREAKRASVAGARGAAAALVECAAAEADAAGVRHTPASFTRLLCACEAAGLGRLGADLVAWSCGAGHPGARPPRGAGAPPTPLPTPAGLAAVVRALARTGRAGDALAVIAAARAAGACVDSRVFLGAIRFGGRSSGGVGAAPAHAALEAATAAGCGPPDGAAFSALARAELDAGSLPNALWAADRAAEADATLDAAAWTALRSRAAARFGAAGAASVDARRSGDTHGWGGLAEAAAAAPPGRAPNIAFDYTSDDD